MAIEKRSFRVILDLEVSSDEDNDFYINPTSENIERLVRESLFPYTRLKDLKITNTQSWRTDEGRVE